MWVLRGNAIDRHGDPLVRYFACEITRNPVRNGKPRALFVVAERGARIDFEAHVAAFWRRPQVDTGQLQSQLLGEADAKDLDARLELARGNLRPNRGLGGQV